jgi:hypothetical protein
MMENFKKPLTFYHLKNTTLDTVQAGFNNSFLAWLLLNLFNSSDNPIWSVQSTNIVISDIPTNQWVCSHITGKLCEALQNNICPAEREPSSTRQQVLNASTSKTNQNCYNSPPCTYPNFHPPKSHANEDCWTRQKEEQDTPQSLKFGVLQAQLSIVDFPP